MGQQDQIQQKSGNSEAEEVNKAASASPPKEFTKVKNAHASGDGAIEKSDEQLPAEDETEENQRY